MPVFIILCLTLALIVQNRLPYLDWLTAPEAQIAAGGAAVFCLLLGWRKKLPAMIWHDGYCSGMLLTWYGFWRPEFEADAPMFLAYPLYFAIISGVAALSLINRCQQFDAESMAQLRHMNQLMRLDIYAAAGLVLAGVLITRHYAAYAMAMTFFILRHSVDVCLEKTRQPPPD